MTNMANSAGTAVSVPETITREYIESVFTNELALIHNDFMKEIVVNTLLAVPKQFWIAPASSSGKYHSADECAQMGLILHTKRVCKCANFLAQDPEYWDEMKENNYIPYDGLIASAILHDCVKSGRTWGAYTVSDHPKLAAELVIEVNGNTPFTQSIAKTIKTHMGWKWGDRIWGNPQDAPKTLCQKLLHKADMMASRKYNYIDVSNMEV